MSEVFSITEPSATPQPIVLSVPHSGTDFPQELRSRYHPEHLHQPSDTDWFVHQLYDFAPQMGITLISARYSRFVIDLNRTPQNAPLYHDGRQITDLCPRQSFSGQDLYPTPPTASEIERRKDRYYWPYYHEVQKRLDRLRETFGRVLFFDGHSIKRRVPSIQEQDFPDIILGSQDGSTAAPELLQKVQQVLTASPYEVAFDTPFKGGHLTRYFGQPHKNQHALQIEMSQDIYMDEDKVIYDPLRATDVRAVMKTFFTEAGQWLMS